MIHACGLLKTTLMRYTLSLYNQIMPNRRLNQWRDIRLWYRFRGYCSFFLPFFFPLLKDLPFLSLLFLVYFGPSRTICGCRQCLDHFRGCSIPGFFLSYISLPRYYFTMYVNSGKARYTHIKRCWDWTGLEFDF